MFYLVVAPGPRAIFIPFVPTMLPACIKAASFMIKNLIQKPYLGLNLGPTLSNPGQYAQPVCASGSILIKWEKIIVYTLGLLQDSQLSKCKNLEQCLTHGYMCL